MVDYLLNSLEKLELGKEFNSSLDNLPIFMKTLKISDKYDKNKLNNLSININVIYY